MPTLRDILKYTPVAIFAMLAVAWVFSIFCTMGFYSTIPATNGLPTVDIRNSDIFVRLDPRVFSNVEFAVKGPLRFDDDPIQAKHVFGGCLFVDNQGIAWAHIRTNLGRYAVRLPIPLLMTGLLPLAIGSFISFRFRLWHYLAFTALIAIELGYYFRWHEWNA